MRVLDRYVLKNSLVPFLYCFFGFLAIWLVFDLSDNGPDFLEAKVSPIKVAYFYLTQLPQIAVICLPVGLLLAMLFSLSRMSRSNELISMFSAGLSVPRVLMPLMFVGLAASGLSLFLNYRLAPQSEAVKQQVLNLITKGEDKDTQLRALLFRDRREHRTWFISRVNTDSNSLRGVHIMQQDPQGTVLRTYYARRAIYSPADQQWTLRNGKLVEFDAEGNVKTDEYWEEKVVTGWSETPARIASASLEAQNLSVDQLREYMRYNSDFPPAQLAPYETQYYYRWALPWACLVVVFISAPLGIVYSRRGVLAGVASSIFIFFGMIFLTNLFLALGKGARVSPIVAAWAPNIVFGGIGLILLWFRATNRDVPGLHIRGRSANQKPRPTIKPTEQAAT